MRRLKRILGSVLFAGMVLCASFLMLRGKYQTVIRDLARTQVMNSTSDLTNDAIARQMEEGIIRYDRISSRFSKIH